MQGADVRALVRHGTAPERLEPLQKLGVTITAVDFSSPSDLERACRSASCVVSAVQGLKDVIIELQAVLL